MRMRVLVADDHPIFRNGLIQSLEETGEIEVVAVASSAPEAIELSGKTRPDVALLDLSMPGNGLKAVTEIYSAGSAKQIAMLTVSEDDEHVATALENGAVAYILKGVSAIELRDILKGISDGEGYVSPGLASRIVDDISAFERTSQAAARFDDLTKREEGIMRRVAHGQSNKEIADALNLQEKTVKHYMTSILEKLHARNRVEAAVMAHKNWRDFRNVRSADPISQTGNRQS